MRWLKVSVPVILFLAFVCYRYYPESKSNATIHSGLAAKWSSNERLIPILQDKLKQTPDSADWNAALGQAYLQKARETGDPSYYPKAEKLFERALTSDRKSLHAVIGNASLAMSRHDFRKARQLAEQAIAMNSDIATPYGVLTDALIELGDYDDAIKTLDRMVRMKPNLSSYSRISYMRELTGDLEGAIQVMRMAVDSGAPDAENTAWCMVQLGNLYLNSGHLGEADKQYRMALVRFPNYVHALGGQARLAAAQKDFIAAAHYYQNAIDHMPLPEFLIGLGDVFEQMGMPAEAKKQFDLVTAIEKIYRSNGVSVDAELALFNADHGIDLQQAVEMAREEWNRRKSVRVADVYAWTLYRTGRYDEADQMMKQAMRLGSRDPQFLRHAEMISQARK